VPEQLSIRRAAASDARAISALSRLEIEYDLPANWTPIRVTRLLSQEGTNAYVLAQGSGISGFSIASFQTSSAHLVLHAVAPGLRRQGCGSQLLRWQIQAGLIAGIGRFSLEVRANNAAGLAFYTAMGFERFACTPRYYANGEDALRMQMSPLCLSDPQTDRHSWQD